MSTLQEQLARQFGLSKPKPEKAPPVALPPILPGCQTLSEPAARAWVEALDEPPPNDEVEGVFDPETWLFPSTQYLKGDVAVDHLTMPAEGANLVIEGDLTVAGLLVLPFRSGGLLVKGTLSARHIVTTAELAVVGELVAETFYGNCTNYCTNVCGKATVQTLVCAKAHYFCFWGGHALGSVIDLDGDIPNLEAQGTPEALTQALLEAPHSEALAADLLRRDGTLRNK